MTHTHTNKNGKNLKLCSYYIVLDHSKHSTLQSLANLSFRNQLDCGEKNSAPQLQRNEYHTYFQRSGVNWGNVERAK